MISFINITKKFQNNFWEKEFYALNNITFEIKKGDLVGFLGANGAGKTTLIKILMDFSRQTSGKITYSSDLGVTPSEIRSSIGYLPERAYLYHHLTGREFLSYVGALNSISKNKLDALIKEWSQKIQIEHALDRHIKGYSKGMQQRLGFISALIHNPRFLVLDEPLSGLDPIGRQDFKGIMKELNEKGITIFFSSHIVSDVEELCNEVVFIEKGNLVYSGSVNELILKNSSDKYKINFLKNGSQESLEVLGQDKNSTLIGLINNGSDIMSVEKASLRLEEIIYKIKK